MFDTAILCFSVVPFFFILRICCASTDSSIQIKARPAGNLCKHFFSFTLISRPAKPETGPSVSEPEELFYTWASAISIPYAAGRLQLRRAHRITTPPKDSAQGRFTLKGLKGILKGRKFPCVETLGAK